MTATLPAISSRVATAGLVVLLLYFGVASVARPLRDPYPWSDFVTFYSAARAFEENRQPYGLLELRAGVPSEYEGWVGRYFYPPPFAAVVVRPLLALPFEVARRLWVVIETLAYLAAGVVLTHLVFARITPQTLFAVGVVMLPFAPTTLDLKLGSVSALLLLLVAVFMWERRRGHATRAALALAAAVVLKLTPAVVVAYLLVRGERALVARVLACIVVLVLAALPWTGVRAYSTYVDETLPFLATANFSWFTNQSLDAFFWRMFVPNPDTTPWIDSPATYRVCTLLALAMVLWALFRMARRESTLAQPTPANTGVVAALCASVLLARVSWEYMLLLALPAFTWMLGALLRGACTLRVTLAVLVAYALCALPLPYSTDPWRAGPALLLETPRLYGMLLLFAALVAQSRRRSGAPEAAR